MLPLVRGGVLFASNGWAVPLRTNRKETWSNDGQRQTKNFAMYELL